jgi:hypothetical protein
MNEFIPTQALETLIAHQGKPAVSIYLPTTRIPTRVQAESLQFKNLLRDAEEQLAQFELRGPEIRAMLEPAYALIADSDFWRHQRDGLAVFIAEGIFQRYQVPTSFDMGLFVSEYFHLKPLIPLITDDFPFYILAVSQNNVRFLQCSRYSAQELEPETVPSGLQEILNEYVRDKQIQFHTATSTPSGNRRSAMFFGTGSGDGEDEKQRILEYFSRIDQGLSGYFNGSTASLVFAGVDYLFPIYQQANTYPHLVQSSIEGNPELLSPEELHQQAWQLLEPGLREKRAAEIERFHSSAPHDLASNNLEELVPWADKGRVETVFIDKNATVWGSYDHEQFRARVHGEQKPQYRDLTDLLAILTMLRGGDVYLMPSEQMEMEFGPDNRHRSNDGTPQNAAVRPVAAGIYRFAV